MTSITFSNSSFTKTTYLTHQSKLQQCNFSPNPSHNHVFFPYTLKHFCAKVITNGSNLTSSNLCDKPYVHNSMHGEVSLDDTRPGCNEQNKLKIAVVGFGNFGQFLAKEMVMQGHQVLAYSRSDYSRVAKEIGVQYFSNPDDLCEEHPEVILLCTSILSTEKVLHSLPLDRLRRSTLFVDVLSVKEFPCSLFLHYLPKDFDILCTHPMFGPYSGKLGWAGLPFVFDKVRVTRPHQADAFLDIFRRAGCRMVEMTCAEHDKHAAGSQFITHMLGRVLEKVGLVNTPINTKGYESLLSLVDNTARDSFELFYGLFLYNKNAMEQLDKLDWAFEMVRKQLSGHLHDLVRKQLMLETSNELGRVVNGNRIHDHSKKLMIPVAANPSDIVDFGEIRHDLVANGVE